MHFAEIPAIMSKVTNLGYVRKRIFNGRPAGFSNKILKNERFFDNAFIFRLIFFTMS